MGRGLFAIGGGKLAELGDGGGHHIQGEINVRGGGVAAEAETQARAGFFRRQTNGGEHMRRLDGARGTGGSGRTSKAFQVQRNEEGFAFDAGKDKICGIRSARCSAAVYARLGNAVQQTLLQFVAKGRHALGVFCERVAGDFRGFAEAYDACDVFCTRAEAALVMSAVEKLPQTSAAADVQGANAFGRINFVAGQGKKIESKRVDVDGDFAGGLHGIGVEIDVGLCGDAADFFEWLDGAELVVGVHDSDKNGFGPDGAAQLLEVNLSFVIGRQIGDAHAFFFESLAGVEDGFVFDGGGDHVLGGFAGTHSQEWLCHNSKDGVVVGFGATAGEDDFLGAGADQSGDLLAGRFDRAAGTLAWRV